MPHAEPLAMQALSFRQFGDWSEVLQLEALPLPQPKAGQIRVKVAACALNPVDWALCLGFMPGALPRGIGLDVAGIVDAVGEQVGNVKVGDRVFGVPDFIGYPSAGLAEYAVLSVWEAVPAGLGLRQAATLPMAVETAVRSLDLLGLSAGQTLLVNGGGSMVGFAAVQIALMRGARVITSAGETFAERLRAFGALVTPYGEGMAERVRALAGGAPDWVLHCALAPGVLPELVDIVDGEAARVMSISDFDEQGLGVRTTGREADLRPRYDALAHYARLAAAGQFEMPIGQTYRLTEWRAALERCKSGRAQGKILLVIQENSD